MSGTNKFPYLDLFSCEAFPSWQVFSSWDVFPRMGVFLSLESLSRWEAFPTWELTHSLELFPNWEEFPHVHNTMSDVKMVIFLEPSKLNKHFVESASCDG